MDTIVKQIQDTFEGQIDFEGQRITEIICTWLLTITTAIALIIGFIKQDIHLTMWVGLGGTTLTMLAVVPPWPFYNRHPQQWIGSKGAMSALPPGGIIIGGKKSN